MARREEPDVAHQPWWKGTRGEWYVIVQFVLFALIAVSPWMAPGASGWRKPWTVVGAWAGVVLLLVGVALAVGGAMKLGNNLTALPYPKDGSELVKQGPYAIVRHPIYSGLLLGAFGWGLLWNAWPTLALAAALFVLFDIKSRREERWLCERYPEYAEYQRRTKRLIPWVW